MDAAIGEGASALLAHCNSWVLAVSDLAAVKLWVADVRDLYIGHCVIVDVTLGEHTQALA